MSTTYEIVQRTSAHDGTEINVDTWIILVNGEPMADTEGTWIFYSEREAQRRVDAERDDDEHAEPLRMIVREDGAMRHPDGLVWFGGAS